MTKTDDTNDNEFQYRLEIVKNEKDTIAFNRIMSPTVKKLVNSEYTHLAIIPDFVYNKDIQKNMVDVKTINNTIQITFNKNFDETETKWYHITDEQLAILLSLQKKKVLTLIENDKLCLAGEVNSSSLSQNKVYVQNELLDDIKQSNCFEYKDIQVRVDDKGQSISIYNNRKKPETSLVQTTVDTFDYLIEKTLASIIIRLIPLFEANFEKDEQNDQFELLKSEFNILEALTPEKRKKMQILNTVVSNKKFWCPLFEKIKNTLNYCMSLRKPRQTIPYDFPSSPWDKHWFVTLFKFYEEKFYDTDTQRINMSAVRSQFKLEDNKLTCLENGEIFHVGEFFTVPLQQLLEYQYKTGANVSSLSTIQHLVGDSFRLHCDPNYAGATFMVASQFNCLEFITNQRIPENGITIYVNDKTQGPACAVAAAPATLVRNYFATPTNAFAAGNVGQSENFQYNNLEDVLKLFAPTPTVNLTDDETQAEEVEADIVKIQNGYSMIDNSTFEANKVNISKMMEAIKNDNNKREQAIKKLKVGVHYDVEIPWDKVSESAKENTYIKKAQNERHHVNQVFCSALDLSNVSDDHLHEWEPLARLVLEASYKATFEAALIAREKGYGNGTVVLTMLGGGAFQNQLEWIANAIENTFEKYKNKNLNVFVTHYGEIDRRGFTLTELAPIDLT